MDRDIVHPEIEAYLYQLARASPPVIADMERLAEEREFPIVGPLVGRLLGLLARSIGARRVFELGSGFGYSAAWFADAVGPDGRVILTDTCEQNLALARDFLDRAGLAGRFETRVGDALAHLGTESSAWDVIFCDVDKQAYPQVPALAIERLRPGGLLIFDNVLWHGRVPDSGSDETTRAVQQLNAILCADERLHTSILPLRDGVSVSLRRR